MTVTSRPTALGRMTSERDAMSAELVRAQSRIEDLEDDLERVKGQAESETAKAYRMKSDLEFTRQQLVDAPKRAHAPFKRADLEGMPRLQLVSLIEEAINEARRKGLVEAEGLLARHQNLSRETDIEMMTGVVRAYQARLDEIAETKKRETDRAAAQVKLDTRTLKEKLAPAGLPTAYSWWRPEIKGTFEWADVPAPAVLHNQSFKAFDQQAKHVAEEAKAKEPKTLRDGEKVHVPGDGAYMYDISRNGDEYACTCQSWKWQTTDTNRRTCKHLKRYLGESAEWGRVNRIIPTPRCHCGIELVRGQCQIHSRDWKGTETCDCGRKFASCKAAYDTISVAQRKFGHQPRISK